MTELAKDLELVVPPGVLALLLAVRVLVLCCCTAPPRQVRLPARRQRLRVLVALALGLGCSAAALLLEASPGSLTWPPSRFAIASAATWAAVWPVAAVVGTFEWQAERRLRGTAWLLLACAARAVPLVLGLLSAAGRHTLLPWLPVQAALLAASLLVGSALSPHFRRSTTSGLLGAAGVEPLNSRTAPDDRAAGFQDGADEQAEAAAMERQRREWHEEQKEHERIAPAGASFCGKLMAFHRLHLSLLVEAKELQQAKDLKKHGAKPTDDDEGYTISDSVASLRRHLWALCPKTYACPQASAGPTQLGRAPRTSPM